MSETAIEVENKPVTSYKDLMCEKDFFKMAIAKIISRFGDSIDMIAYGWLVFELTGSTALLAILYGVSGIPSLVFSMISGVVVTYAKKKTIVCLTDFGRGLVVCLTAVLFITGQLAVWHLFVLAFFNSTLEAFRGPAEIPLMMQILPKEKLEHGVASMSSGSTVSELIGYSVASVMIGTIGVGYVILVDAITFIVSGLLISRIKMKEAALEKVKLTVKHYLKDLGDGVKYVWSTKLIVSICLFFGSFNLFILPLNALQPAYVDEILHKGPEALSVMSVSLLIAMFVGGVISPKVKQKLSGKGMFILSGLMIAVGYFGLAQLGGLSDSPYLYIALVSICVIMGLGIPMLNFPLKVALMKYIEGPYLSRAVAFIDALALSSTPIGGGLVGLLILYIPLQYVFILFSMALVLLFGGQIFNRALDEL